ncbi:MAG: hypothetical protein ABSG05_00980 [Candidatus Pacearchaeota archaeon]|jgi:type II secretory pathway pseudopilin PulG
MNLKKRFLFGKTRGKNYIQGQVWVETVIYTLVAFALMGLVLAFVVPKVQETQDKGIIQQSVGIMNNIDTTIRNLGSPGNQRVIQLSIQKGSLTINATSDQIIFNIESNYQYSQPGENVTVGNLVVQDEKENNIDVINMALDYSGLYNLSYNGQEISKTLTSASTPYTVTISDQGQDPSGNAIINFQVS